MLSFSIDFVMNCNSSSICSVGMSFCETSNVLYVFYSFSRLKLQQRLTSFAMFWEHTKPRFVLFILRFHVVKQRSIDFLLVMGH